MLNVYALKFRASKYIKQKLRELKKIDKSTILVGDFNIPLSVTDRASTRKVRIENALATPSINLT